MNAILIDTLKAVRNSCCRAISVAKISDWIWCCSSWLEWRSRVSIMPLSTRQAMADRQWWFSSTEAFCSRHDIPTHWHHYQHAHLSIIHTLQEGGRAEGRKGGRGREGETVADAIQLQHIYSVPLHNSFFILDIIVFCTITPLLMVTKKDYFGQFLSAF